MEVEKHRRLSSLGKSQLHSIAKPDLNCPRKGSFTQAVGSTETIAQEARGLPD